MTTRRPKLKTSASPTASHNVFIGVEAKTLRLSHLSIRPCESRLQFTGFCDARPRNGPLCHRPAPAANLLATQAAPSPILPSPCEPRGTTAISRSAQNHLAATIQMEKLVLMQYFNLPRKKTCSGCSSINFSTLARARSCIGSGGRFLSSFSLKMSSGSFIGSTSAIHLIRQ